MIGVRRVGECGWLKDQSQNWQNMAKGQDQKAKTLESISEGIANSKLRKKRD